MKSLLLFVIVCLVTLVRVDAQITDPKKKAKRAAENRVNTRVDQGINRGMDKAEEAIGNIFKKKDKKEKTEARDPGSSEQHQRQPGESEGNGTTDGQSDSFLDFEPGTDVLFSDNFEQDALMDFPAKWNSTGSGKVVTVTGAPGRWLEIGKDTYVNPVIDDKLPENCTIEFDLYLMTQGKAITPVIEFGLTEVRDILKQKIYYKERFYTSIKHYGSGAKEIIYGTKLNPISNNREFPFSNYLNKPMRVSISVNKERVRVYFDQTKILDLPRIISANLHNNFYLANTGLQSSIGMYIGNIRIAQTGTDARSLLVKQLMEDGKAVTNDILFDVNSDVIKSSSFTIIKQLGEALTTNPSLRIKIIGHTDGDGADAANLTLSKKRAEAVKNYLMENFSIAGSRIQTEGKGESQPVASNNTNEGKEKNRRVEFVKL